MALGTIQNVTEFSGDQTSLVFAVPQRTHTLGKNNKRLIIQRVRRPLLRSGCDNSQNSYHKSAATATATSSDISNENFTLLQSIKRTFII